MKNPNNRNQLILKTSIQYKHTNAQDKLSMILD